MKVGLGTVPTDILRLIFEFVNDSSPASTQSLAIVNRHVYRASKLVRHTNKTVVLNKKLGALVDLSKWIDDENVRTGLRHLTVKGCRADQTYHATAGSCTTLIALIKSLSNLKRLTWDVPCSIPTDLVRTLETSHERAELYVNNWSCRDPYGPLSEEPLLRARSLVSLRTVVGTSRQTFASQELAAFCKTIVSAPNLRLVSIVKKGSTAMEQHGRHATDWSEGEEIRPSTSVRSLTIDGYSLSSETLEYWSNFVDLSCLESLKCSRGVTRASYFDRMPTTLKHVALNVGTRADWEFNEGVTSYIARCDPLESLSIWSWYNAVPLSLILSQHGSSLRTLQLHERDDMTFIKRQLLFAPEFRLLQRQCPKLRDLTIDQSSKEGVLIIEQDREVLNVISEMSLDRLQIYYDTSAAFPRSEVEVAASIHAKELEGDPSDPDKGSRNNIQCKRWQLTDFYIEEYLRVAWKIVFGQSNRGNRSMDAKFGEWERNYVPGFWETSQGLDVDPRSYWHLCPAERDDQLGQCDVKKHRPREPVS